MLSSGLAASKMVAQLEEVTRLLPRELSKSAIGVGADWDSRVLPQIDALSAGKHTALTRMLDGVKLSESLLPAKLSDPAVLGAGQLARVVLSDDAFTQWRAAVTGPQGRGAAGPPHP